MQIDAQLVRDLFACCRKMQQDMHSINGQIFAFEDFFDDSEKGKLFKANIESIVKFIYDGQDGFPEVARTLERTRTALTRQNEWMPFSDYVGFRPAEGGKE